MKAGWWLPVAVAAIAAAALGYLNRGEAVIVNLGLVVLYRAPLSVVLFATFLFGMVAMMLLSLPFDLALRRRLRERVRSAPADDAMPLPSDPRDPYV